MQTNTVQTLIDYVKDITGQTNVSDAKVIRALNFAVDAYSYIKITASGRWKWDSRNHGDLARVTATTSDSILTLEDELSAVQSLEVLVGGKYQLVENIDQRDSNIPLSRVVTGTEYATYFDLDGRAIRLYPAPTGSWTYRLTFSRPHPRYTTSNLTADTGVEPIHEEYIALYAADKIMLGTNDSSRVAVRNELLVKEREIRELCAKRDQSRAIKLPMKINVIE